MSIAAVERYSQLCALYGHKKIIEIEIQLEKNPSLIDASKIYLPRKHFKCLFELIKERSEIGTVKLDNCSFTSKDLTDLFESLRETRVSALSLRNVQMTIQDGEQIKELCKLNPHIIEVDLSGTFLPEGVLSTINLAIELNKSLVEERNIEGLYSIATERMHSLPQIHVQPTILQDHLIVGQGSSQTLSHIMNEIIEAESDFFIDKEFCYEEEWFQTHYPGVIWERGLSLVRDEKNFCTGNAPVIPGTGWRNKNLCGALNVLQREERLKKAILSRDMRDVRCFGFRFFINDQVHEVLIDDFLPFVRKDEELSIISAHSGTDDYWGPMVEKGIAKLYGGYSKIDSFSFYDYVALLTGGVCVGKTWRECPSFTVSEYFARFRTVIGRDRRIIGLAVPQNPNAEEALLDVGISPNLPYTIISTDICVKDGNMEYLVQLVGPVTHKPFKDSFKHGPYQESEMYGFPVFWMRFTDFCIYLEDGCSIIWAYAEHNGKIMPTVHEVTASPKYPSSSPLFASNPAFRLEYSGDVEDLLLLTFECADKYAHIPKQFFFYTLGAGDDGRRYNIGQRNLVDLSRPMMGKRGGVTLYPRPGERLQLVIAAGSPLECIIRTTSYRSYSLRSILDSMRSTYVSGEWNYFYEGLRVPNALYAFRNISSKPLHKFIVALGQEETEQHPYGISLMLWPNSTPAKVQLFEKADMQTEPVRETVGVFVFSVRIDPGNTVVVLPCRHDEKCPPRFRLAFYSDGEVTLETETIPRFLFE